MTHWSEWFIRVLAGLGGVAGISTLLMVRAQKRKLLADTGKTTAEADSVVADAQSKRQQTEVSLIEPMRIIQNRMTEEMKDLYARVDRLQAWAESMVEVLRKNNLPVPEMPPEIKRKEE